jgi:type II secretory pathway component PulF
VPYFTYKGRDASGKLVKGTLEGASNSAIADRLMATGVTPLDIAAASAPATSLGFPLGHGQGDVRPQREIPRPPRTISI